MKKERKHYTAEEKVAILRRHLVEQVPVAEIGRNQTAFLRIDSHKPTSED